MRAALMAGTALFSATSAVAQSGVLSSGDAGEITVTAQKRAEKFQDVPIPLAALGGEDFEQSGVSSVDAIRQLAPRLIISNVGSGFVSQADARNQQILRTASPGVKKVGHASAGRRRGGDLAFALQPEVGLRLTADVSHQEALFSRYRKGAIRDAGNRQLRSPDFRGSFGLEYRGVLPGRATFRFGTQYRRRARLSQHGDLQGGEPGSQRPASP